MRLSNKDPKYPYTYSADFIRLCGLADSRADAAEWAARYCEENNLNSEEFKMKMADLYIERENKLSDADDIIKTFVDSISENKNIGFANSSPTP